MALWEYLWAGSDTTKLLCHLNWNANDSSWNGNNWTASNVSRVGWKVGGGAASFNGTSSYISFWYDAPTSNWTYSYWIKPTNFTAQHSHFHNFTNESSWRNIYIYSLATTWVIVIDVPYVKWNIISSIDWLTAWVWNYVTVTRSWNTWSIYFNWVLKNSVTDSTTQQSTTSCRIGRVDSSSKYYLGWFDEVIVENRAWTATEVQKYYTYASWKFGIQ